MPISRWIAEKGQLSNNRRKQLLAKGHPEALLRQAEEATTQAPHDDED